MLNKICNEACSLYCKTGDIENGVCSAVNSYFPVAHNSPCRYSSSEFYCKDCDRYENDPGCFTAQATDKVENCSGFMDKKITELNEIIFYLYSRYGLQESKNIIDNSTLEVKEFYEKLNKER